MRELFLQRSCTTRAVRNAIARMRGNPGSSPSAHAREDAGTWAINHRVRNTGEMKADCECLHMTVDYAEPWKSR